MKADPSDAILPCNRSMAHLKLKQSSLLVFSWTSKVAHARSRWREAARDATKSLELQPSGNGKALFRRATARKGLGDVNAALSGPFAAFSDLGRVVELRTEPDFEAALALDPKNESILAELKEMKARVCPTSVCFGKCSTTPNLRRSRGRRPSPQLHPRSRRRRLGRSPPSPSLPPRRRRSVFVRPSAQMPIPTLCCARSRRRARESPRSDQRSSRPRLLLPPKPSSQRPRPQGSPG